MATITQIYKINEPVPFLDIDPEKDNLLFNDPCRIRIHAKCSSYAAAAKTEMETFLTLVARKIMAGDLDSAYKLLGRFNEPNETRLGMALRKFRGRGGGDEIGQGIATAMATDLRPLLALGILKHLENLPLFVPGIDRDITSDITTRLVFNTLINFTQDMMRRYPQLAKEVHEGEYQIWDSRTNSWSLRTATLPSVNGAPLLLVPAEWAGPHLLMSARRYYEKTILDWVQEQYAVRTPNGRIERPRKKSLQSRPGYTSGRDTNVRLTLQASEDSVDLVNEFTAYVEQRYEDTQEQAA